MIIEKLIEGINLSEEKPEEEFVGKNSFCSFYSFVKIGHHECGDSAAIYCDEKKAIFAVFDGVSGANNASLASSIAANEIISFLKDNDQINEEKLTAAFVSANKKIKSGATTAVLVCLEKSGRFLAASVGDSPLFWVKQPESVSSELPLDRVVVDGNSIMKFFAYRNIVTAVLGSNEDLNLHFCQGELKPNQFLILVSDGISDNLFVEIKDGDVVNSSGTADLSEILMKPQSKKDEKIPSNSSESISKKIISEVLNRINHFNQHGHREFEHTRKLVPKVDDISIISIKLI